MYTENMLENYDREELTEMAYDKLCYGELFDLCDFDIEELRNVVNLGDRPNLCEGVAKRLSALGIKCSEEDTSCLLDEVRERFKRILGKKCPRTIEEWFRGTTPGVTARINNYDLCIALECDLQETAVFFRKYYLTNPFNYKDRVDAIFFYCIAYKKPYYIIADMIEKARLFETTNQNDMQTMQIGQDILEIEDDELFMEYLKAHCFSEEQQYATARKEIMNVIRHNTEKNERKSEMSKFHEEVMGFNYQSQKASGVEKLKVLPDNFLNNLPTDRTFLDILEGKKESYETMRKALIILWFFDYYKGFGDEEPTEEEIRSRLLDFYDNLNEELMKCGLVPMYERHPFDRLILFCATNKFPIGTFHGLNDLRHVDG